MKTKTLQRSKVRKGVWIHKADAERLNELKMHPSIPLQVMVDECVSLGIKAMEKARGRQRRTQTVVQG